MLPLPLVPLARAAQQLRGEQPQPQLHLRHLLPRPPLLLRGLPQAPLRAEFPEWERIVPLYRRGLCLRPQLPPLLLVELRLRAQTAELLQLREPRWEGRQEMPGGCMLTPWLRDLL